ncbi:hypothetical protein [Vibrio splendidus]|uniref:hypothetical protein n=1 Tax=Vibrio splendidus TaxID=29497 RepID=UPI0021B37733|nr:hypothetical protein [Vibrio splendidus]UWZ98587.1 hypothetical protein IM698_04320 [Vibrio splendidus]
MTITINVVRCWKRTSFLSIGLVLGVLFSGGAHSSAWGEVPTVVDRVCAFETPYRLTMSSNTRYRNNDKTSVEIVGFEDKGVYIWNPVYITDTVSMKIESFIKLQEDIPDKQKMGKVKIEVLRDSKVHKTQWASVASNKLTANATLESRWFWASANYAIRTTVYDINGTSNSFVKRVSPQFPAKDVFNEMKVSLYMRDASEVGGGRKWKAYVENYVIVNNPIFDKSVMFGDLYVENVKTVGYIYPNNTTPLYPMKLREKISLYVPANAPYVLRGGIQGRITQISSSDVGRKSWGSLSGELKFWNGNKLLKSQNYSVAWEGGSESSRTTKDIRID